MCNISSKQAEKINIFSPLSLIFQPPSGYLLCRSQVLLLSKFAEHLSQLWWGLVQVMVSGTAGITAAQLANSITVECAEHFPSALYKSSLALSACYLLSSTRISPCYLCDIKRPLPYRKQWVHLGAVNGEEFSSLMEAAMANSTITKW